MQSEDYGPSNSPFSAWPDASIEMQPVAASPWRSLACAMMRQALHDAAHGNHEALQWMVHAGRDWLALAEVSSWIVDEWASELGDLEPERWN